MRYSAYVPCFNNAATVRAAVESIMAQSVPPAELIVVDDGSIDDSSAQLRTLPVRVVRHETNRGRGAARARAMLEAQHEFVLCCDATNVLAADFAARALPWFEEPSTAAVFGRIDQRPAGGVVHRWRGRHVFRLAAAASAEAGPVDGRRFATWGAMVRRSAVLQVGNYDARLRRSEDAALGGRLEAAGWRVAHDSSLQTVSVAENTLAQVLERYWRWNAGADERTSWLGYANNVKYSLSMASREIADPGVAAITLLCPHYCFWRSRWIRNRSANPS